MEMGRKPPSFLVRPTVLHEPQRCIRAGGSFARQNVTLTKARSEAEMLASAHRSFQHSSVQPDGPAAAPREWWASAHANDSSTIWSASELSLSATSIAEATSSVRPPDTGCLAARELAAKLASLSAWLVEMTALAPRDSSLKPTRRSAFLKALRRRAAAETLPAGLEARCWR